MPTLYDWVSRNNPPQELQYSKGWWDCIEFYYLLTDLYEVEPTVVTTFKMATPPPTETLTMPIVRFNWPGAMVVIKHDFGQWPNEWTLCVKRSPGQEGLHIHGLFDPEATPKKSDLQGIPMHYHFKSFQHNPEEFVCQIRGRDELFAFLWLLNHGANAPFKAP